MKLVYIDGLKKRRKVEKIGAVKEEPVYGFPPEYGAKSLDTIVTFPLQYIVWYMYSNIFNTFSP